MNILFGEKGGSSFSFSTSETFRAFLKEGVDRRAFIESFFSDRGVSTSNISLSTGSHILVNYPKKNYNKKYKDKVFVAHYDRVDGSQGANDNSAATFMLMHFALYLSSLNYPHNIQIIFTDSEEAGREGILKQGSYKLALGLRKLDMIDADIYIFDMCGCGNTIIISRAGLYKREAKNMATLLFLHNKAFSYAKELGSPYFSMLTAYSDNAGFIAGGLKAQLITVLPYDEALTLYLYLEEHKDDEKAQKLLDLILKNKKIDESSTFYHILPSTWQKMNSDKDTLQSLTDSSFSLITRYMKLISKKMERW